MAILAFRRYRGRRGCSGSSHRQIQLVRFNVTTNEALGAASLASGWFSNVSPYGMASTVPNPQRPFFHGFQKKSRCQALWKWAKNFDDLTVFERLLEGVQRAMKYEENDPQSDSRTKGNGQVIVHIKREQLDQGSGQSPDQRDAPIEENRESGQK